MTNNNQTNETEGLPDEAGIEAWKETICEIFPQAFFFECEDGRWMAWETEADSIDDDGQRAVAVYKGVGWARSRNR